MTFSSKPEPENGSPPVALFTADQLDAAVAAERERCAKPTPEAVAWALAEEAGEDPGHLIWEGCPPEPWGEAWCRYMPQAERLVKLLLG
ncbi:MAG: hypothetical protein IPO08_23060 [Xanthomonadales bacterium]|nr:hypothetical protein [Xanthomonadales bacterium]